MVATACKRVLEHQFMLALPISTADTFIKDQALAMDPKKKDMINNINVIMIIFMLNLLEWSPAIPRFGF